MATRRWYGRAAAVAEVKTLTPAVVSVGSTFTVTIDQTAVTVTATTTVVADVTALLAAALQASEDPKFTEITWADETTLVSATGPEDGATLSITATAGGTGSPTHTLGTRTTGTGPNFWSVAANWKENAVPVTGDDVVIDEGPSILYGTDQNAVTLASLTITPNFPAESDIGLPRNSNMAQPDAGYPEFRQQRLKVGFTLLTVDTFSRRIRLDGDTDQMTAVVHNTGRASFAGEYALDIIGVNASSVLRVNRGQVGVAPNAGEVATFSRIDVAYRTQRDGDADVTLGSGLTLTDLQQTGGSVILKGAVTTITKEGGRCERYGSGAVTTWYNRVGEVRDTGTGTITTLYNAGDWWRDGLAALTVTNCTLYGGSRFRDKAGTITWTNAVNLFECEPVVGPDDDTPAAGVVGFDFGRHRKITIADI